MEDSNCYLAMAFVTRNNHSVYSFCTYHESVDEVQEWLEDMGAEENERAVGLIKITPKDLQNLQLEYDLRLEYNDYSAVSAIEALQGLIQLEPICDLIGIIATKVYHLGCASKK